VTNNNGSQVPPQSVAGYATVATTEDGAERLVVAIRLQL